LALFEKVREKLMLPVLSMFLVAAPLGATAGQSQIMEEFMHQRIDAHQLKSWYDEKKKMVVLDARSKEYFDGTLLPQAKWVSAESTEEEIQKAVPNKKSVIVVYCASKSCPASGWLYDKLTSMGYTDVHEYHGGLKEWQEKKLPTTHHK
jgi:rhodanese-related sulfurtransferase